MGKLQELKEETKVGIIRYIFFNFYGRELPSDESIQITFQSIEYSFDHEKSSLFRNRHKIVRITIRFTKFYSILIPRIGFLQFSYFESQFKKSLTVS